MDRGLSSGKDSMSLMSPKILPIVLLVASNVFMTCGSRPRRFMRRSCSAG
jgi:hypothetical protein